jgi:serine/threonine protein kinase
MMFYEIETSTLLQLTHPNIIEFIESFTFDGYFCIIYEYCDNGSVKQKLNDFGHFDELTAIYVVYIIAQALKTLKAQNFIHRDIKPDNILIKGDSVKLADFGFCTKNNSRNNGIVGSPLYMSPESLQ